VEIVTKLVVDKLNGFRLCKMSVLYITSVFRPVIIGKH